MLANRPAEQANDRELLKQLVGRYFISEGKLYYVEDFMFNAHGILIEDCNTNKSVWVEVNVFKKQKKKLLGFQADEKGGN